MAKKGNNNLLLIAAVAVGGYFLWKKSAAPAPAAVAPGLTPTLTADYSSGGGLVPQQPTQLPFGLGVQTTAVLTSSNVPNVANDPRLTDIMQWAATLSAGNQAQLRQALVSMTQDEIAGLYDIVHNDFYGNGITTDAQRQFWNTWRVKYHVLDGTVA